MQKSLVMFFSAFDQKNPYSMNLIQKLKIVSLTLFSIGGGNLPAADFFCIKINFTSFLEPSDQYLHSFLNTCNFANDESMQM